MNNLYHWHAEKMVSLEMRELNREVENIRLLNDAAISNPGRLAHMAESLGGWLVRLGKKLQKRYSIEHQYYASTSGKLAR